MASTTQAPAAEPFKLNGVTIFHDEPYPYLDQAHALALMVEGAVRGTADDGGINDDLLSAALRGIASLIELASIGLTKMDAVQASFRAAEA